MKQPDAGDIVVQMEAQAAKVARLVSGSRSLDLERLRDETAALQALIAEAARLERRGLPLRLAAA